MYHHRILVEDSISNEQDQKSTKGFHDQDNGHDKTSLQILMPIHSYHTIFIINPKPIKVSGHSTTTATSLMEHRIDLITVLHVKLFSIRDLASEESGNLEGMKAYRSNVLPHREFALHADDAHQTRTQWSSCPRIAGHSKHSSTSSAECFSWSWRTLRFHPINTYRMI